MQLNICLRDLPTQKNSTLPPRVPTHAYADCKISGQQPTHLYKEFPRVHEVGHWEKNDAHIKADPLGQSSDFSNDSPTYLSSYVGVYKWPHCRYLHCHTPWQVREKHVCTSFYTLCKSGSACVVWLETWMNSCCSLSVVHVVVHKFGPVISQTLLMFLSGTGRCLHKFTLQLKSTCFHVLK